jgi:DNA-binding protein Fis
MINISINDKERKVSLIVIKALNDSGYCITKIGREQGREIIEVEDKNKLEEKKLSFQQSVKELEDFFISSNEKELYKFILTTIEKPLIEDVLEKCRGNKLQAAQILGINRNTLQTKIKKLGIKIERWRKK